MNPSQVQTPAFIDTLRWKGEVVDTGQWCRL